MEFIRRHILSQKKQVNQSENIFSLKENNWQEILVWMEDQEMEKEFLMC